MKTKHLYIRQFNFDNITDMYEHRNDFIEKDESFYVDQPDKALFVCVDVSTNCVDNKFIRIETFVEDCNVAEYNEILEKAKKARDANAKLPAPSNDC